MDIAEIEKLIAALDNSTSPRRLRAQSLDGQASEGDSGAWTCSVQGNCRYIVKLQNNRHERYENQALQFPLKLLPTELVCGRLGRMFDPPVCPETAIIDVADHIVAGKVYRDQQIPLMAGPSVGSEFIPGSVTSRQGALFHLVTPEQGARIVVFRTWLNPADDQEIVSADTGSAFSIDHGWYLTGPSWDASRLSETTHLRLPSLVQNALTTLEDSSLFRSALNQLTSFSDTEIVAQFAGMPPEWGMTCEFRAQLAAFILARRSCVEQTVSTLWRR